MITKGTIIKLTEAWMGVEDLGGIIPKIFRLGEFGEVSYIRYNEDGTIDVNARLDIKMDSGGYIAVWPSEVTGGMRIPNGIERAVRRSVNSKDKAEKHGPILDWW